MSIYALERGIPQAPGTRRSIEIIKHRLRRPRSITKRTSFSFDDASVRDTTAARKLMRSSFESAHTHPMGAPAHTTAKSSPPIIPEIYGGSQTEAAPGSSAAATGAAVSDYQGQNWTYDLSSASTAKDTQSHPSPEADGWSTLYSLLTADDILYPAVEAGKQDGMHAWGGSPDLQSRRGMGGGLGQIDLSQGAMAMPSFINPQGTQKTWPEHFDDWN